MAFCRPIVSRLQGAKKVIFTACHLGKLKLTFTSPNIISTSPKNVLTSRLISQFFCNLNSSKKKITCPSGKLITRFPSPIANSTSPGLSDTTFFTRCVCQPTVGHVGPLSADFWSTVYQQTTDRFLGELFINFTKRCLLSEKIEKCSEA